MLGKLLALSRVVVLFGATSVCQSAEPVLLSTGAIRLSAPSGSLQVVRSSLSAIGQSTKEPVAVSIRYLGAAEGWLRAETTQAGTVTRVAISADPGGLGDAVYAAEIEIAAGPAAKTSIPVTLTVGDTGPGEPKHAGSAVSLNSDRSLVFSVSPGSPPPTIQAIPLRYRGENAGYTVETESEGWLLAGPRRGTTGGEEPVHVGVDGSSLPPGIYSGSVRVTRSGETEVFPVSLTVGRQAIGFTVNPERLHFEVVYRTPPVYGKISLAGASSEPFTVRISTPSPVPWLKVVHTTSNMTPASVMFSAEIPALNDLPIYPGLHTSTIFVTNSANGESLVVPVTMNLSGDVITVEPDRLAFTQASGSEISVSQTISVGSPVWRTGFDSVVDVPWLTLNPNSGNLPMRPTVTVSAKNLAPGTHLGKITLKNLWASREIPVSFVVTTSTEPLLTPATLRFDAVSAGPSPAPQSFSVASRTSTQFPFTISADDGGRNWLKATSDATTTPAWISVLPDSRGLAPGTYTGSVRVTPLNGGTARSVTVGLVVADTGIYGVLHGATLRPAVVSPGMIVTVLGRGMGPGSGQVAAILPGGLLPTTIGGTKLLFDGVPAPLLFVRADQINAVVPYGVAGRAVTRVQVENSGTASLPVDLRIVSAVPGVFVMDSSGMGQAAALNQDGSVNGGANPEAAGRAVVLFGTGEGLTSPPGQDGGLAGLDLRRPIAPVTASVGGIPVEVLYAGSSPGMVSGAFQVNLLLNDRVPKGPNIPVEVRIGDAVSAPGVTIAVK